MSLRSITPRAAIDAAVWLLLFGFIGTRVWPQIAAAFGVAAATERAPDFQLTTLDGRQLSRESLRGKVVLLNFWATWCPPCRIEMPGFQRIYDRRRDDGFVVLGVSTDGGGSERVGAFLRDHGITYPVAMATGQVVGAFGGANMLPTSFLIDREGRIRHQVRGVFTSVALEPAVDRLLAEPVPAEARRARTDLTPPAAPPSAPR